MSWGTLTILWLIFLTVTPALQLGLVWARRRATRRRVERERGSHVIAIVHSLETVATYGVPLARFEQLPLEVEVVSAVHAVAPTQPIDLLVDLAPELPLDPRPVAAALRAHSGPVTMVVPRRALTAGASLAEAADALLLGDGACVSDVDTDPLDAAALRAQGLHVQDTVPDCFMSYLALFGEPAQPHRHWPPYIALRRHR